MVLLRGLKIKREKRGYKMADAFLYMYIVSFGSALGVATVAWIGWKVVLRSIGKTNKKAKRGIV